jgi:hypothetical protein
MVVGTFFTLFFVPAIYVLIARSHHDAVGAAAAEARARAETAAAQQLASG